MNNLQYVVKDNARYAMHVAVELCEQGDFDTVRDALTWLALERDDATHGTLTDEQVRNAVLDNFEETHETYYDHWEPSTFDWQAIADELNAMLGSGTCENLSELNADGVAGYHFSCSECGLSVCASMGIGEIELSGPRSFHWKVNGEYKFERCPRCGKAVKR